jgi:hypothetical protein
MHQATLQQHWTRVFDACGYLTLQGVVIFAISSSSAGYNMDTSYPHGIHVRCRAGIKSGISEESTYSIVRCYPPRGLMLITIRIATSMLAMTATSPLSGDAALPPYLLLPDFRNQNRELYIVKGSCIKQQ